MSRLPKGWVKVKINDVVTSYETLDPRKQPRNNFKYVDISSIDNQLHIIRSPRNISGYNAPSRARRVIRTGDVLFSTVRTYLKNIAIVPSDLDGELASTGLSLLRPNEAVTTGYLFNWVRSDHFISAISKSQDGTLYPAVRDKDILNAEIMVPPLAEQNRIVDMINVITNRVGHVLFELNQIQDLIYKYKTQIWNLAFTGKVTSDFRKKSTAASRSVEQSLPKGWTTRTLGEIGDIKSGVQVGKKRDASIGLIELPYLRVANVQRGWLDLSEIKTISVTSQEKESLLLERGDLLMNEGGDRDKLGRGWIWEEQLSECIHQNHVFRVRLFDKSFPNKYISYYANEKGQSYFFDQGTQTTNLASISKRKLAALPIPIPPLDEAIEIVSRIEAAFKKMDRVTENITFIAKLLSIFNSDILTKALCGKLIPQDPSDEPVNVFLNRIQDDRSILLKRSQRAIKFKMEPTPMNRTMLEVLTEAKSWLSSQEVFERCGIFNNADTDDIEKCYAELRDLDKSGLLDVKTIRNENGQKQYEQLKLKETDHATRSNKNRKL